MFADARPNTSRVGGLRDRWRSAVLLAVCWLALSASPLFAANPPPVQVFYVPGPEDQVYTALSTIWPGVAACNLPDSLIDPAQPIINHISISAIAEGTVIYYDHWEDGFEIDISQPTQATTQIWGDGNPANGAPPGIPADQLGPNTVVVLRSSVTLATRGTVIDFDGGDKVAASRTVAMTRATWDSGPGTLQAGTLEVYPVDRWGTSFRAPAGVNTPSLSLFEYTAMMVMAANDNTNVQVDANADGTFETTVTLDEGESYLTPGNVRAGARVLASAPVQVAMITGDICDYYEARWYVLFPESQWSSVYYSPVSTVATNGTTAFLYNPNLEPITITRTTVGGVTQNVMVNAGEGISMPVPAGSGARFATAGGQEFIAIAAVDTTNAENSKSDWGFALIPEAQLTMQTLIGWGAGQDPGLPVTENSSPVWVIGVDGGAPVEVCVDYDADNAGPLTDANGFRYDLRLSLDAFEIATVYDSDGDQTGMLLYVCGDTPNAPVNGRLAAAWGQDPAVASSGPPALDLGTTAPPAATFEAAKLATLLVDVDGDGKADAGDSLRYQVIIRNAARVPIAGVNIRDTVPLYTTYLAGTTTVDLGSGPSPLADDSVGTPFPLDVDGGVDLGTLPVRGVFTVTFDVRIGPVLPDSVDRVANLAVVRAGDETRTPEVETPIDRDPVLVLSKATNGVIAERAPGVVIDVGTPVTWTYVVTNTGPVSITVLSLTDSEPGVTPTLVGGDGGIPTVFEVGEVWTFQALGVAISGQYSNTATAVGTSVNGVMVTDTAVSHYFGISSAIDLTKVVSRQVVTAGTQVVYTFTVTNIGLDPLTNVELVDDQCVVGPASGDVANDGILAVGETWTYTCTRTITKSVINVATVTALNPLGQPVSDTDSAAVVIPILYIPIVINVPEETPCPPPNGCPLANEIKAMAVNESQNRLYVLTRDPDELLLVEPRTTQVLTRVATAAQPWGIAVDAVNNRVYVSGYAGGDVRIYDGTTLALLKTLVVGTNPSLIEFLPDAEAAFVLVRGGSRVVIIEGLEIAANLATGGSGPFGIAADPVKERIFISHRDSHSMSLVHRDNGVWQVVQGPQFEDERQLFELAYDPGTNRLYVVFADVNSNWFLGTWEPHTQSLWGQLPPVPLPSGGLISDPKVGGAGLAFNPATQNVFNANTGADSLSAVDGGTLTLATTVALGNDPFAVAVDSIRNMVYIGLRSDGRLIKLRDNY